MKKLLLITTCLSLIVNSIFSQINDTTLWIPVPNMLYNMSLITQVEYNSGTILDDPGCKLAAFKDAECRGVADIELIGSNMLFQLSIFSNFQTDSNFTFKIYDGASNQYFDINDSFVSCPKISLQ